MAQLFFGPVARTAVLWNSARDGEYFGHQQDCQ
jgi:hypothetical protein